MKWAKVMRGALPRVSAVALVAVAIIGLAACGGGDDDTLETARDEGFVRVGFANEEPASFATGEGELTGSEVDLAEAVLKELGVERMDGVLTTFDALIPGLQAERFDLIVAGQSITPERCEQILFTDPHFALPEALAVPTGNPKGLNNLEDVAESGASLGVMAGAVEAELAEAAGVDESNIDTFTDQSSLIEAVAIGRLDGAALLSLSLRAAVESGGKGRVEVADSFFPVVDGEEQINAGGFGFRKGDTDFRDAFNRVLDGMKEDGEILPVVKPYGFGAEELDAAKSLTADELCSAAE